MATYKITHPSGTYKVTAPDEQGALDAFVKFVIEAPNTQAAGDPVTVNNLARSAATGVPIVGGLLNKADALTNATLAPVLNPLFDDKDQLKGDWSERYAKSLAEQQGMDANFAEQHPVIDTGAKLAGGIAATAPLAAAAPGVFGATGNLGRQILNGGITNAVIGGTDAATRGEGPVGGAIMGGVLGAGAPVATKLIGAVTAPIASRIMAHVNPERYAQGQIARGVAESGQTPAEIEAAVRQAAAEGQGQFNVADVMGSPGQRLLSTVARANGEGRTAAVNALESRQAGQGRRVANALSEGFEAPQTAAQTRAGMEAARNDAADTAYGAVRNDAQPVDVTNVLDHIDANVPTEPAAPDTISGRLQRYHRMLSGEDGNLSDFASVQRVRSELSDEVQTARQAGQGNRARMLGQVLRQLDTSLESASPGFRQANADFAQASRNINAIDQGRTAALRGRTEDTIPAFNALTPEGQAAFRTGYADPLIEQAQGGAYGVNKARPLTSDAFRDEAAAMAPGNDLMQRRLARENTMFQTRNTALGGSKTADNLADQAAMSVDPALAVGVIGHVLHGNAIGAMHALGRAGAEFFGNTPAVRAAVGRYLLANGTTIAPGQLRAAVDQVTARVQRNARIAGLLGSVSTNAITTTSNAVQNAR